ncbi:MAG TPA: ATP-dependent carboligase [Planctomycetales bacterium]|nr:ATP-dependent carboligase [Planctomycetales bacterium]
MDDANNLILFGASTRAAAFSALRAGMRPWCADLFADADLQARCPAMRLPGAYPEGFLDWIGAELPGPWMYTGGLENRPYLVERMAFRRPLWGNDCPVLLRARSPDLVRAAALAASLHAPTVKDFFRRAPAGRWLVKPIWGLGEPIHFWTTADADDRPSPLVYLQEFIEGESRSAVFCADGNRSHLLGVTRQLVGEGFLHTAPFHYCGSVGPLRPDAIQRQVLERFGSILARKCGLRGLFGVDGIVRDGDFWPVEVNPRYTASIEVLEYALGLSAMAWHRAAFVPSAPRPALCSDASAPCVGKAVYFARGDLRFPDDGPWNEVLRSPPILSEPPAFADIPHPGTAIKAGWPILTLFAHADTVDACLDALRRIAADLDRLL